MGKKRVKKNSDAGGADLGLVAKLRRAADQRRFNDHSVSGPALLNRVAVVIKEA